MTKQKRWIKSWLSQVNQARKQREIARRRAKQEGYLVVLGIMKNEALILQEWIDHYRIRSREYFEKVKMTRGDSNIPGFIRDWAYFAEQDANCSIEDRLLATQVKDLRT